MALSSPESPVPPRRVVINRTENPSEEHEELNKMAHGVVAESRRFVLLVEFSFIFPGFRNPNYLILGGSLYVSGKLPTYPSPKLTFYALSEK